LHKERKESTECHKDFSLFWTIIGVLDCWKDARPPLEKGELKGDSFLWISLGENCVLHG
jgi:hypothetical protein